VTNYLCFALALSLPFNGLASNRLQANSSNSLGRSPALGSSATFLLLLGAAGTLAGIFYFSWAFMNWKHLLASLFAGIFLTGFLAKSDSKGMVWLVFCVSGIVMISAEVLLLIGGRT
jgi:hypothetical protein